MGELKKLVSLILSNGGLPQRDHIKEEREREEVEKKGKITAKQKG